MAAARAAYQKDRLDDETVEIYWRNLGGFDYDDVEARLQDHIKREEFFPRISDLRPPDRRGRLGPRYLEPPRVPEGVALANKVLLGVVLQSGGVSEEKLEQLVFVKNAEAADYDEKLAAHDTDYKRQFIHNLQRELGDQLDV